MTSESPAPSERVTRQHLGFSNVVYLGVVSPFTDISSEMVLGILPFFVINDLHATKALLGLMEGAAEFTNHIFRVFAGFISDRIARRKPLVLAGYALSAISKPFFAAAGGYVDALLVRVTDRIGKGVRTSPRDALISDSVDDGRSGRAFGLHRSLDQIGAVAGPSLAFLLIPLFGARGVFLFSLLPGAAGVLVLLFFVRDKVGARRSASIFVNVKAVLNRRLLFFLAVVGVFTLGAYNFSFVLVKAGSLGVDSGTIPLVYAALNVGTVAIGFPVGVLADRFSKAPVLMLGFGFFLASSLVSMLVGGGVVFAFLIALVYGLYLGTSDTVQRAIVPALAPAELKGTAYAVYYTLIAVCSLLANFIFGALWDNVSTSSAFEYSLVTSVLALVGLLAFISADRKSR